MKTQRTQNRVGTSHMEVLEPRLLMSGAVILTSPALDGGTTTQAITTSLTSTPAFTIDQSLSDFAQQTTLAFDGLAIMTDNLDAQSFFPPGKVADYTGFQYLRDNDPDNMGHNTSFLTRIANNVIYILNDTQFAQLKSLAVAQMDQINLYAYERYSLMEAFRRLVDGDMPTGCSGLSLDAVKSVSRELYLLDGQISFDRALLYANIYSSMTSTQLAYLDNMKGQGFNSWPDISNSQIDSKMRGLPQGTAQAVMTYAGDLFSWYAGSIDADVYFCPERHGTYYGGFYIKDAPAVGHEGYSISEELTATAGAALCDASKGYVTEAQASLMSSLVDIQRNNLYAGATNIVQVRTQIATLLRGLLTSTASSDFVEAQVLALSSTYGDLDGENNYNYATIFARVYSTLTADQETKLMALRQSIMSGTYSDGTPFDYTNCTTPFLYSSVITDTSVLAQYVNNTDSLFERTSANTTPVIAGTTRLPALPSASDPVWITSTVTDNACVGSVALTYYAPVITTVFTETMGSTDIKPWTGSGAVNPWTVTGTYCEQRTGSNYGTGNPCGLEYKAGPTVNSLDAAMMTTTSSINAAGTSGYVEFYLQSLTLDGTDGWTFQLDSGSGYVTRLSELAGSNHGWQKYHYDLAPGELVSGLHMRFQFTGGGAGDDDRIDLDQITVAAANGTAATTVAMYDDGVHGDGTAGDHVYGGQIPAMTLGTTVGYYVTADDTTGLVIANPTTAPSSKYSYLVGQHGDFNGDGVVNATDIDLLNAQVGNVSVYDLTGDGIVSQTDRDYLVKTVLKTAYGDANLDHKVDFTDFQTLLDHWQLSAGWATGDWTGDGKCDFLDFQKLLDNWNPTGTGLGTAATSSVATTSAATTTLTSATAPVTAASPTSSAMPTAKQAVAIPTPASAAPGASHLETIDVLTPAAAHEASLPISIGWKRTPTHRAASWDQWADGVDLLTPIHKPLRSR